VRSLDHEASPDLAASQPARRRRRDRSPAAARHRRHWGTPTGAPASDLDGVMVLAASAVPGYDIGAYAYVSGS
jgi:hypothetical protein